MNVKNFEKLSSRLAKYLNFVATYVRKSKTFICLFYLAPMSPCFYFFIGCLGCLLKLGIVKQGPRKGTEPRLDCFGSLSQRKGGLGNRVRG